jgi:hypothetical protein
MKTRYQVKEGEARPITLREFRRLKPGGKVLVGFPNLGEVTFIGHSEKHPRSWFKFKETIPGSELHWSNVYVWTIPDGKRYTS